MPKTGIVRDDRVALGLTWVDVILPNEGDPSMLDYALDGDDHSPEMAPVFQGWVAPTLPTWDDRVA